MKLKELFSGLARGIESARDRRAAIDAEIGELVKQRTAVLTPVLPYEDFKAYLFEQLDTQAAQGTRAFEALFAARRNNEHSAARFLRPLPEEYGTEEHAGKVFDPTSSFELPLLNPFAPQMVGPVSQAALLAVLGPAIKDGVGRMLDQVVRPQWPSEVGLPRAERMRRAADLSARIEMLLDEKESIERTVREAAAEFGSGNQS